GRRGVGLLWPAALLGVAVVAGAAGDSPRRGVGRPHRRAGASRFAFTRARPRSASRAGGGSAPATLGHRRRPLRHLLGGHVLDVGHDAPPVSPRILDLTGAVTVELVLDRTELLRAGLDRVAEG